VNLRTGHGVRSPLHAAAGWKLGIVPKIAMRWQYAPRRRRAASDDTQTGENIYPDTKGPREIADFGISEAGTDERISRAADRRAPGSAALTHASAQVAGPLPPLLMRRKLRDTPSVVDHRADIIFASESSFTKLLTGELGRSGKYRRRLSTISAADPACGRDRRQQALEKERERRQHSAGR
jgi:hypothetical protein